MSNGPDKRRGGILRSYLWGLAAGMALALASMIANAYARPNGVPDEWQEHRRELRGYLVGFGLAVVLTGVAFASVYWSLFSHVWREVTIGVLAFIQIIFHLRYFLHIDPWSQKKDGLHLILFSTMILLVMVGGTIWILANLATRMH